MMSKCVQFFNRNFSSKANTWWCPLNLLLLSGTFTRNCPVSDYGAVSDGMTVSVSSSTWQLADWLLDNWFAIAVCCWKVCNCHESHADMQHIFWSAWYSSILTHNRPRIHPLLALFRWDAFLIYHCSWFRVNDIWLVCNETTFKHTHKIINFLTCSKKQQLRNAEFDSTYWWHDCMELPTAVIGDMLNTTLIVLTQHSCCSLPRPIYRSRH